MAAEEAGDAAFGGVLKPRRNSAGQPDPGRAGLEGRTEARTQQLLDAYFGADERLPAGERFLKSFIRDRVRPGRPLPMLPLLSMCHALPQSCFNPKALHARGGRGLRNTFHAYSQCPYPGMAQDCA